MSSAMQFYISSVLIVTCADLIAAWGLDLQFGSAGINNLAFIVFAAAGAYTAAVLSLGPSSANGGAQSYVGGAQLPFPLPIIAGMLVAGALAAFVGAVTLRRLRGDYEAVVLLVLSLIATAVAEAEIGLVNGPAGLSLVPKPLTSTLGLPSLQYQWVYFGWCLFLTGLVFLFLRRLLRAPFGRNLRAVRDNQAAAAACGRNVFTLRMQAFVVGGVIAGLSGALLVEFVNSWSPGSWLYPETLALLTAIIVGGRANMGGVAIGTILVPILFLEVTRFLPTIGYPGLIDSLEWVIVGLLTIAFMWWRPQGLLPERRRRFAPSPTPALLRMKSRPSLQMLTPQGAVASVVAASGVPPWPDSTDDQRADQKPSGE
jgi:branched-chain amino acid transport system permease protein